MKRRGFLASLFALPSAVVAASKTAPVEAAKEITANPANTNTVQATYDPEYGYIVSGPEVRLDGENYTIIRMDESAIAFMPKPRGFSVPSKNRIK